MTPSERASIRGGASSGRRTPLASRGEPAVWLTGLALLAAFGGIIALLLIVAWGGLGTFWPRPIDRVTLVSGEMFLGVPVRDEAFDIAPLEAEALRERIAKGEAPKTVVAADGRPLRRLYRVGNKEFLPQPFRWAALSEVRSVERPTHAVFLEREQWGVWVGIPREVREGERIVASGEAEAYEALRAALPAARERREEMRSIATDRIGDVNWRIEKQRLQLRLAELRHGEGRLSDARLDEVRAETASRVASLEAEYAGLNTRLRELEAEDARHTVVVVDPATGRFAPVSQSRADDPMRISQIIRAVHPNALPLGDKLAVYASRWWEFLSTEPREANTEGGVMPVIFGTVMMTLLLSVAVAPLGVITALYLREYAKQGVVVSAVRIAVSNLAGVPSIVYGVFGLGFFCYTVGAYIDGGPKAPWPALIWAGGVLGTVVILVAAIFTHAGSKPRPGQQVQTRHRALGWLALALWIGLALAVVTLLATTPYFRGLFREKLPQATFGTKGILWASLTLALMTLPVVIVATEEAISAVPRSLREGSYGCGASRWQTVRRIVLPRAAPGIMTGLILAMARGAGEVAPLMLVGAAKLARDLPFEPRFPFLHLERSFMHLGFHIYDLGFQSPDSEAARPLVWTTTLLLIVIITVLNGGAIAIRARLRKRFVQGAF